MRAAQYQGSGGREVLTVRDVSDPAVGTEDALVAVSYAGLNRADILEREGRYGNTPRARTIVPGLEFSGIVRAVGSHVTSCKRGDRVCGLVTAGAHAELVATNAATLSLLPDSIDLQTAAATPEAFTTAHDALFARGRLALGETVLVHAVGSGVGLAAVTIAKHAGAIAIGTSRTAEKLRRAREYGLDVEVALDESWPQRVLTATGGRGVDVVLDFVGAPILDQNVSVLASGGRIVQIGTLAGARAQLSLGGLMAKRATLIGTMLRSRPLDEKAALARMLSERILPLVARGELRVAIDRVFLLDDIAGAHRRMESDENFGKILIRIGGESPA